MTNCKTCIHKGLCKKEVRDGSTYRICSDYWGTCENCENKGSAFFFNLCHITREPVKKMISCGEWKMKEEK